jgi:hypothetical protein
MRDLVVELTSEEWVPWCPQDNRGSARSQQQANRSVEDAPALDLVQRARYLLRVSPLPASELPPGGEALFAHGLLTLPLAPAAGGGCVERVCVMNVSDRLVRVHHGMRLLTGSPPQPPSPPRPASDGEEDATP